MVESIVLALESVDRLWQRHLGGAVMRIAGFVAKAELLL